jgi:hypothetical protein
MLCWFLIFFYIKYIYLYIYIMAEQPRGVITLIGHIESIRFILNTLHTKFNDLDLNLSISNIVMNSYNNESGMLVTFNIQYNSGDSKQFNTTSVLQSVSMKKTNTTSGLDDIIHNLSELIEYRFYRKRIYPSLSGEPPRKEYNFSFFH